MTSTAAKAVVFSLLFCMAVVAGCGVVMQKSDSGREEEMPYFDPFSFGDEFSTERVIPADSQDSSGKENSGSSKTDNVAGETATLRNNQQSQAVYGYRIHLGVFNSREDADRMAEYARSRLDVSVYTVYEPPFYRVRAGDFRTREDATNYANNMKSIDRRFNNAYPLQSPINTP